MRKNLVLAVLAALLVGATAAAATADDEHHATVIRAYGATPFLYGGSAYVPLRSAAEFVGAALLWDSVRNRATVTYNGRELGLVVGSTAAYYGGQQVVLPGPPIVVGGQVLVPAAAFHSYLDIPVQWNDDDDRVLIRGLPGWGYFQVLPQPPPYVVQIIRGYGPPPWAPAHGRRRQGYGYYSTAYVPAPFIYSGTTYIPLRDATDIIGAALLWDSLKNRAVITYNGREIGLAVGSPTVYYGGQTIVLQAAPVIVNHVLYVPSDLFERHMKVPIERSGTLLKIRGKTGWKDLKFAPSPPQGFESARSRRGSPRAEPVRRERGPSPPRASVGKEKNQEHGQGKAKGKGGSKSKGKGQGKGKD